MSVKNQVSANLNMLFTKMPLLKRYKAAADAGFNLVEVSLPYSETAESLKEAAEKFNLKHTLINAPAGNWVQGFRGIAALKSENEHFQKSIETAIKYAKILNCPRIHVMAGVPKNQEDLENAEITFYENIKYAAKRLAEENLLCLIEPINQYTINGYYLSSYDQAMNLINKIQLPNLKIQYDVFHAQQINGQLTSTIKKLKDHIDYIQVAQVPNRGNCNSTGEINYKYLFDSINSINPLWIIGFEYTDPESENSKSFDWVSEFNLRF